MDFGFLMNISGLAVALVSGLATVLGLVKTFIEYFESRKARERLRQAEDEAFKTAPELLVTTSAGMRFEDSASGTDSARHRGNQASIQSAQAGSLFNLYNAQIERYQTETLARAGRSFLFAIIAMVVGLVFVGIGGTHILADPTWQHVAAGTSISAIGGATGAYITKTFLDIHRLSLSQLNYYFRQPVVNAHVLTAQRLADQLDDDLAKRAAYEQILGNVVDLIREDNRPIDVLGPKSVPRRSNSGKKLGRTAKSAARGRSKANPATSGANGQAATPPVVA